MRRHRTITLHTWDYGRVRVPLQEPAEASYWLSKVLREGLWKEVRRFPRSAVARLLPHLKIPPATRRFLKGVCQ